MEDLVTIHSMTIQKDQMIHTRELIILPSLSPFYENVNVRNRIAMLEHINKKNYESIEKFNNEENDEYTFYHLKFGSENKHG
jgi:ABC-type Na+ transport system ATPase subunit NatA